MQRLLFGFVAWAISLIALVLYFVNWVGNDANVVMIWLCIMSLMLWTVLSSIFALRDYMQLPEFFYGMGLASTTLHPSFGIGATIILLTMGIIPMAAWRARHPFVGIAVLTASLGVVIPLKMITTGASEDFDYPILVFLIAFAVAVAAARDAYPSPAANPVRKT